jgi:DUF1009 family protein
LHFSTAVSLEDFLVFLLEMADYISGASRKYDIQKAEIKLRLITDTYMLQYHHAKFSRNKISPICKLCGEEDVDRVHFLLECKTLEENRKTQMVKLGEALEEASISVLFWCSTKQ